MLATLGKLTAQGRETVSMMHSPPTAFVASVTRTTVVPVARSGSVVMSVVVVFLFR